MKNIMKIFIVITCSIIILGSCNESDCWQKYSYNDMLPIIGIWAYSSNAIFIPGDKDLLRLDATNGKWDDLGHCESSLARAPVWGSSPSDVYFYSSLLCHYNGSAFQVITTPAGSITAIWGSSATDIYAAIDSHIDGIGIYHYNQNTWELMLNTDQAINHIAGTSSENVFAAGTNGTIYHYDGVAWVMMDSADKGNIISITANSDGSAFTVNGNGVFQVFDGSDWKVMDTPNYFYQLYSPMALWSSSRNDLYFVVSQNYVNHYDGKKWSDITANVTGYRSSYGWIVNDISGVSPKDVFIGGGEAYNTGENGEVEKFNGIIYWYNSNRCGGKP